MKSYGHTKADNIARHFVEKAIGNKGKANTVIVLCYIALGKHSCMRRIFEAFSLVTKEFEVGLLTQELGGLLHAWDIKWMRDMPVSKA